MSKIPDKVLLVPGEAGWEIWTGQAGTGFTLQRATDVENASEIGELPSGEVFLFFPVKSVTAVPMRVTSDDESLFSDLAALHAERLGLRPDPMAGQLTDTFTVAREPDNSTILNVHLRPPTDQDLPKRGPKGFDISPRAYPLAGNQIAVWKEFGRWAYAISHNGQLIYCQLTSSTHTSPDENLTREIRLALIQLSLQGIDSTPNQISLWTSRDDIDTTLLAQSARLPIQISPRPAPILPNPLSKLLPDDVRAARKEAKLRSQITLAAVILGTLYLGVISWLGYGLWKTSAETKKLVAEANAAAPEGAAYADHIQKWDELSQAIDLNNSPVDIMYRISRCIPLNSGLRLKSATISATEVSLTGDGPQLEAVKRFSLNLSKSNDLTNFIWETPEPNNRDSKWEFKYTGLTAAPAVQ